MRTIPHVARQTSCVPRRSKLTSAGVEQVLAVAVTQVLQAAPGAIPLVRRLAAVLGQDSSTSTLPAAHAALKLPGRWDLCPGQLATHPLRGALFKNAVVAEALKHRFNRGYQSNVSFFRDARGLECDLLYETGSGMGAIEIKAGATITSSYFQALNRVAALIPHLSAKAVVYGGTTRQLRSDCEVVPLGDVGGVLARLEVNQETAASSH